MADRDIESPANSDICLMLAWNTDDAPHPKSAHLFIDYMLRPDVAAKNSGTLHSATSNVAAYPLIDPAVYHDKSVHLSDEQRAHLFPVPSHSQPFIRELNRTWTRFKTGH